MTLRNRTIEVVADELHTALKSEAHNIIGIGSLLAEAKANVKHGEWLPWLKTEFSMSERTARRYMKAYAFAESVTVTDFNLSPNTLYLLSEDDYWADDSSRDDATAAVLKEASERRVGYNRAKEIIEGVCAEVKAKSDARIQAIAAAMADDMEKARRDVTENGSEWNEDKWRTNWLVKNWGQDRDAEFEAKWKEEWSKRQVMAQAEAVAPQPEPEVTIVNIVPRPEADNACNNARREGRPRTASRKDLAACDKTRTDRMDAIGGHVEAITEFLRDADRNDRNMIRKKYVPYLDGWFGRDGKLACECRSVPDYRDGPREQSIEERKNMYRKADGGPEREGAEAP